MLAIITNLYNPVLLIISIILSIKCLWISKNGRGLLFIFSAVIVYGLMFLDKSMGIWEGFGSDYSTHTATALAMCLFIGSTVNNKIITAVLVVSFVVYGEFMVLLNYHSWGHILSTAVVVGAFLGALYYATRKVSLFSNKAA